MKSRTRIACGFLIPLALMSGMMLTSCSKNTPSVNNTAIRTGDTNNSNSGNNPSTSSSPDSVICLASNLSGSISQPNGTAGSQYYQVTLVNNGSPCSLKGFAGVSLIDSSGNQIGAAAQRDGSTGELITLKNGENSIFDLQISNAMAYSDCDIQSSTSLKIYPPENREWLTIPLRTKTCSQDDITTMTIGPMK